MQIQPKPTMNINLGKPWEFDQAVAKNFLSHAEQHIPDYDRVVTKCVKFVERHFKKDAQILDFGSATGYTLEKFRTAGFRNLYGIDSSEQMIAQCRSGVAKYVCADTVPADYQDFDVILSNWTLQFVEDKVVVLREMHRALKPQGNLFITEKISQDPRLIDMYHAWKQGQGVSKEEIELKAQSLAGVLKVQDHRWWLDNLTQVGFNDIQIVNANWCFCTYLCTK